MAILNRTKHHYLFLFSCINTNANGMNKFFDSFTTRLFICRPKSVWWMRFMQRSFHPLAFIFSFLLSFFVHFNFYFHITFFGYGFFSLFSFIPLRCLSVSCTFSPLCLAINIWCRTSFAHTLSIRDCVFIYCSVVLFIFG